MMVVFVFFFCFFLKQKDSYFFFFFFQAEDGIRDHCVTGVQTCALPILWSSLVGGGHDFLVRVGANVNLLTTQANCDLKKEGKNFRVYCWPNEVMRAGHPPLKLRLVQV